MNPVILQAARYCKDVYPVSLQRGLIYEFPEVLAKLDIWHAKTDTHVRLYLTKDKVFFAIQGTKEPQDWITNFKVRKRKFFGIFAHRGFVEAAQSVLPEVESECAAFPGYEIVICGHSLGGAVGVVLAYGLQEMLRMRRDHRPITLITFGQPKVATAGSLKELYGTYLRVQNGSDLVPRRPNIPLYFSHAGTNLYMPNKLPGPIIDPSWWVKLKDRLLTGLERLHDHSMDEYIWELERCELQSSPSS